MNVPLSSYYRIYVIQGFTFRSDPARTQRGGAGAGNLFQHQLTVMYVYLGPLVNVGAGHRQRTAGEWALYGVGLLATIAVTVFVTRLAKKALAKKISSSETGHNPGGL